MEKHLGEDRPEPETMDLKGRGYAWLPLSFQNMNMNIFEVKVSEMRILPDQSSFTQTLI